MRGTLYRDAALADGTGPDLRVGVSLLVDNHTIQWIRPADDEPDPGPDVDVLDASGCTVVPGLVDSHSHLTLAGGAHWIDRGFDPAEQMSPSTMRGCCGRRGCAGPAMSDLRSGPIRWTGVLARWPLACATAGRVAASTPMSVPRVRGSPGPVFCRPGSAWKCPTGTNSWRQRLASSTMARTW